MKEERPSPLGNAAQGQPEPAIMSRGNAATRWNLDALESTYQQWRQDPTAVDESWQSFFQGFELGLARPTPGPRGPGAAGRATTPLPAGADFTKAQIGI